MTTHWVDNENGSDTYDGTSRLFAGGTTGPFKNDPDWANATGLCAALTLADDDIIYHRNPSGVIMYPGLASEGFKPRTGINGVLRETDPTDYAANGAVKYSWLQTHTSTADWAETSPGSNIWEYQSLGVNGPRVGRLWINGVAQKFAALEIEVDATNIWFGDLDTFTMYCTQNPFDEYGGGEGVFEFCFYNGLFTCPVYLEDTTTTVGTKFTNMDFYGGRTGVEIEGGHHQAHITNCDVYAMSKHGMRSVCTTAIPNKYNRFTECRADTLTNINEWDLDIGENQVGVDGFVIKGPNIGGIIEGCHSQDFGHTAFVIEAYSAGIGDFRFGCHANRITKSPSGVINTCDNRNQIYGRAIGCGGSRDNYPSTYNVISHVHQTNMQTRSQIAGYRNVVEWCNLSNCQGTYVTGTYPSNTNYFPDKHGGEGLSLFANDGGAFPGVEAEECVIENNVFVGNALAGLHIQRYGFVQTMGGNVIQNNIFLDNNLEEDDLQAGEIDRNLTEIAGSGLSAANVYTQNHANQTGGDVNTATFYIDSVLKDAADFNAYQASNTNNSNTVTRIAGDGRPVTGADIAYGTLKAVETDTNLIPEANRGENMADSNWWTLVNGTTISNFGTYMPNSSSAFKHVRADPGDGVAFHAAWFSWSIDEYEGDGNDCYGVALDGVIYSMTTTPGQDFVPISDTTPSTPICDYREIGGFVTSAGTTKLELKNTNAHTTAINTEFAFMRFVEGNNVVPWPLHQFFDQKDLENNTSGGTDYIGAYSESSIGQPYMPNVVEDVFGNTYTEATAQTEMERFFYVKGTVTTAYSDTVAVGDVLSQSVDAGTQNAVGTTVDLLISLGPEPDAPAAPSVSQAFVKKTSRQAVMSVTATISQADLPDGAAVTICDLPHGAVVVSGAIYVISSFDSDTSDTLKLGYSSPGGDVDDYWASSVDAQAAPETRTAITLGGRLAQAQESVIITNDVVGAPGSAGEVLVVLDYVVKRRATEIFGRD